MNNSEKTQQLVITIKKKKNLLFYVTVIYRNKYKMAHVDFPT